MCGICGAINFDRKQWMQRSALEAMNQQIVHRGPDDAGFYLSENVGLAMRRLSIIDLATGHQPVSGIGKSQAPAGARSSNIMSRQW